MTDPTALVLLAFSFALGAAIGSFLNVCIARWPAEQSVIAPGSRCPGCGHRIRWYENVPIASWLALRGRCSGCHGSISPQYLAVELVVALGWVAAVWAFGPTFTALRVAVFGTIMVGIAITDAMHYLIPDGFTVFGLLWVLGTAVGAALLGDPSLGGGQPAAAASPFVAPADALLGACAAAGAIAIVGWLGEVALKKEAMGFGDVTLMAVVGAAVGPWLGLLTVFVGAFVAAVVFPVVVLPVAWARARRAGRAFEVPQVPFGVFLAPAALLTLLWGRELVDWYVLRFRG